MTSGRKNKTTQLTAAAALRSQQAKVSCAVTGEVSTSNFDESKVKTSIKSRELQKVRHQYCRSVTKRFVWVIFISVKLKSDILEVLDQILRKEIRLKCRLPKEAFCLNLSQGIISCISGCNCEVLCHDDGLAWPPSGLAGEPKSPQSRMSLSMKDPSKMDSSTTLPLASKDQRRRRQ